MVNSSFVELSYKVSRELKSFNFNYYKEVFDTIVEYHLVFLLRGIRSFYIVVPENVRPSENWTSLSQITCNNSVKSPPSDPSRPPTTHAVGKETQERPKVPTFWPDWDSVVNIDLSVVYTFQFPLKICLQSLLMLTHLVVVCWDVDDDTYFNSGYFILRNSYLKVNI